MKAYITWAHVLAGDAGGRPLEELVVGCDTEVRRLSSTRSLRSAKVRPSRSPELISAWAIEVRRHDSEIRSSSAVLATGCTRSPLWSRWLAKLDRPTAEPG